MRNFKTPLWRTPLEDPIDLFFRLRFWIYNSDERAGVSLDKLVVGALLLSFLGMGWLALGYTLLN